MTIWAKKSKIFYFIIQIISIDMIDLNRNFTSRGVYLTPSTIWV